MNRSTLLVVILLFGCETRTPEDVVEADPVPRAISERPSGDDWTTLWNAAPDDPEDLEWEDEPDSFDAIEYTYVNSLSSRQPYGLDYADDVKEAVWQDLSSYLEKAGLPVVDEYGGQQFARDMIYFKGEAGGEFSPIDRTIELPLTSPDLFTAGCVRHLQSTVLKRFPLWRIYIVPTKSDGEPGLTVYADAVRVRDAISPPGDLDQIVTDWQQEIRRIREPVEGPTRRQARYVRKLLPKVLPTVPENGVALIAVFDDFEGDTNWTNAWIAFDKSRFDFDYELEPPGEHMESAGFNGIDSRLIHNNQPFDIYQCLLPSFEQVTLTMRHEKSGDKQRLIIRRADAIEDDELKRLLGDE